MREQQSDYKNLQQAYTFANYTVAQLTENIVWQHSSALSDHTPIRSANITPEKLEVDSGTFHYTSYKSLLALITVNQQAGNLSVSCNCHQPKNILCEHQTQVLLYLLRSEKIRVFFDASLRHQKLQKTAADYGLENEANLDEYFYISYADHQLTILPHEPSLISATPHYLQTIGTWLFNNQPTLATSIHEVPEDHMRGVVLRQHKYYKHLIVELYDGALTKEGKFKNPLTQINPLLLIAEHNESSAIKFLTAVSQFQQSIEAKKSASALSHLKAIVQNPLDYTVYKHVSEISEKVTANALTQVQLHHITDNVTVTVKLKEQFYHITGTLKVNDSIFLLKDLNIQYDYFIALDNNLYLTKDLQTLGLIQLFKGKSELLVHHTQYQQFKIKILSQLEERLHVNYTYIKPGTSSQLKQQQFTQGQERIVYLSDFGQYIMIIPVMRYGDVEISIRTQKQIHAADKKGNEFLVKRDEEAEQAFMALLIKQHPHFEEQLDDDLQYFYLHRKRFLDADWFLDAFEEWRSQQITILGFNELSGNNLNSYKVKVSIQVLSGIDWFNTKAKIYFGRRRASMKHLHKAIRNKSKFVPLDDGTMGIIPEEWIAKFVSYFEAGEVLDDDTIITPKVNYAAIAQLYEKEMLSEEVQQEIDTYHLQLTNFEGIDQIPAPAGLLANLRPYQLQGLNWLNFLDDFNFGGILADDMGLGKTLQIIAFILLQRIKARHNTNLLIVPTSLIFNWQAEVQKFAPCIKIFTVYGADRVKTTDQFNQYEIILTTYGTLLSDLNFLKNYHFNYIFLDESQNIKNPESSRYKAVRLLQSRNKVAITGTPIENNTFDLYSQLSFACPGLLGSKQFFKDIYSSPIDKFKVSKRALELQNRIRPFLLRRTKEEVATELPDKTEMVLYCEMQEEQRKIYNAYEKEFREFVSATTNEELPKSSMHVLKGLTRLRQICNSPALLGEKKLPGDASAKIEVLMEQIENRSAQHKILVFSQFVGMLDLIKQKLIDKKIGFAYLTGSTRNREAEVTNFQLNPDTRVFLISLKAGGAGLNLTAADYVYLVDPWWNPAVENQAIDRCYRIGQHKNVVAVRLICPDTIEDKVQQLQASKKELVSTLIKNNDSILKGLSRTELVSLLDGSSHKF